MPTLLRAPVQYITEPLRVRTDAHKYFSSYGEEELFQVRNWWRAYSRRKELIDFGTRRSKIKYFFDDKTKRYYRKAGYFRKQYVPTHYIKLDINRFASNMCMLNRELTQALLNKSVTVQDWYGGILRSMKYSYRAVIDVARGSSLEMSVDEEREYLRVVEEEVDKFNLYSKQIAAGDIPLDGRIMNAACSLGRRLNRIFENWKLWDARRSGFVQARRRLTPAEHCRDSQRRYGCVTLARRGWQSIHVITPIGGATCWDGCLCEMEYR